MSNKYIINLCGILILLILSVTVVSANDKAPWTTEPGSMGERQAILKALENEPPVKDGYHCVNTPSEDGKSWTQECQLESDYLVEMTPQWFTCEYVKGHSERNEMICHPPAGVFDPNNLSDEDGPYLPVCDQDTLWTDPKTAKPECLSTTEIPEESVPDYLYKPGPIFTPPTEYF